MSRIPSWEPDFDAPSRDADLEGGTARWRRRA
jgi:hypothetical protein